MGDRRVRVTGHAAFLRLSGRGFAKPLGDQVFGPEEAVQRTCSVHGGAVALSYWLSTHLVNAGPHRACTMAM